MALAYWALAISRRLAAVSCRHPLPRPRSARSCAQDGAERWVLLRRHRARLLGLGARGGLGREAPGGEQRRLGAVGDVEALDDLLHVRLDRALRHGERVGDELVGL